MMRQRRRHEDEVTRCGNLCEELAAALTLPEGLSMLPPHRNDIDRNAQHDVAVRPMPRPGINPLHAGIAFAETSGQGRLSKTASTPMTSSGRSTVPPARFTAFSLAV